MAWTISQCGLGNATAMWTQYHIICRVYIKLAACMLFEDDISLVSVKSILQKSLFGKLLSQYFNRNKMFLPVIMICLLGNKCSKLNLLVNNYG